MQVAIWRDSERKRLVVAFRGTEQVGHFFMLISGVRCIISQFEMLIY